MKKTLLALMIAMGMAASQAATYNIGDTNNIYLGFWAAKSVSEKSTLINLGTRENVLAGFSLDFSGASSIISQTYGSSWFTSPDVYWSVVGIRSLNNVWMGKDDASLSLATPSGVNITTTAYNSIINAYNPMITAHGSGALSYAVTGGNSYQISVADNTPSTFNKAAEGKWNGGIASSVFSSLATGGLDIQEWTWVEANGNFRNQSTIGTVTQSGGVISVVPEPSTYALFGIGALLLIVAYRRKTAA